MHSLKDLYEQDFYAWTQHTAKALKNKQFDQVDIDHLLEEVESMGRSDFRELRSRLVVLVAHLLKWAYQPSHRSSNWTGTITKQRQEIDFLLQDSPSLKNKLNELVSESKVYDKAVKLAVNDTGLDEQAFPKRCPYSVDQLLDDDYYPQAH